MVQSRYEYRSNDIFNYEFTSIGPNGPIEKGVTFTYMSTKDDVHIFNLAFGDLDKNANMLDDLAVTDNKDTLKVLTTVAQIVLHFTACYPNAVVYASGSSEARNRLYRMAINKYWNDINKLYDVYGRLKNGLLINFTPRINFIGFAIKRKIP